MLTAWKYIRQFMEIVKSNGATPEMDDYDRRRLGIFNLLNFFGLLTGIVLPVAGYFNDDHLPLLAWVVACSPAVISMLVLVGNYYHRYELAMMCYFTLYPLLTFLVYADHMDVGIALFFILYGVASVFFLQKIINVVFSFSLSITCYLLVTLYWKDYHYRLQEVNPGFYFFNHLLANIFIFYALYLIKKENTGYQSGMLKKNAQLQLKNTEIEQQRIDIAEKASLLEAQTLQLTELHTVKNKLFSIISHDLKSPMYGLRNLFRNMQQYDLPGEEIKLLIPDIINDLNYTTGLMDNLLQWAKIQMQANSVQPKLLDVGKIIGDTMKLLRLQANAKQIYVESKIDNPVYVFADKDMLDLVIRNLLSNAIKFTPEKGEIVLGVTEKNTLVEIFVQDNGKGISKESLEKISGNNFYSTKGTANEIGTGLGLMLCKEFLIKNGGQMHVSSELGKGSIFSFTLPKGA